MFVKQIFEDLEYLENIKKSNQIFEDLEYLENIKKSNHNMKRSHSGQLKQTEQEKTWE